MVGRQGRSHNESMIQYACFGSHPLLPSATSSLIQGRRKPVKHCRHLDRDKTRRRPLLNVSAYRTHVSTHLSKSSAYAHCTGGLPIAPAARKSSGQVYFSKAFNRLVPVQAYSRSQSSPRLQSIVVARRGRLPRPS